MKTQLESLVLQMYRSGANYSESVKEFKRTFIRTVLADPQIRGNQCKAARRLQMHRNSLRRTRQELGMERIEVDRKGIGRPLKRQESSIYFERQT